MKRRLIIAALGLHALGAQADIYKSVDAEGHVTYSNIPTRGAKKLNIEPLTTMPRPSRPKGEGDFRVDSQTQKMRDDTRYKILRDELSAEEARLQSARQAEQGGGGRGHDDVVLHEKNIEALRREISNLK